MSDNPFASPQTAVARQPRIKPWEWAKRFILSFCLGLFWWAFTLAAWLGVAGLVYGDIPNAMDQASSFEMFLMAFSNMASAIGGMVGTLAASRLGDRPRRQLLACSTAGAVLASLASSFLMLVSWSMDFHAEEEPAFLLALLVLTVAAGILGGNLGRKWVGTDHSEPAMTIPALGAAESSPRGPGAD